MRNDTRTRFNQYATRIALLNGVASSAVTFAVDPVVEQRLEGVIRNSSEFLQAVNIIPVTNQKGQALGIQTGRSIAGRTNTANNNRRQPAAIGTNAEKYGYVCEQTNYDWSRSYNQLDAWRHLPNFETILRDDIAHQIALDRIMIGFHGVEVAATTDRDANPNLEDVNEGWLFKLRENAPEQVIDDGDLSVLDDGTNNPDLSAIYVKAGGTLFDAELANAATADADYSSLDALVRDAVKGIHERHRSDTDLVVVVGHELVDDKYFNIAQSTGATATEVEATDRILRSAKSLGGLPAIRVSGFPANAIMITKLSNLSIYWQEGTRRRRLVDEPEYDRVANYESLNEAYVIEEYELAVLVENIVLGASPVRVAAP